MKTRTVVFILIAGVMLLGGCGRRDSGKPDRTSSSQTDASATQPSPATTVVATPGQTPKVIGTTPANGTPDVDPGLGEIVVIYDVPVKLNSYSLVLVDGTELPELVGDPSVSFRDNRTCAIKVKLKPNTAYGLGLNSKTRQGFKSALDGTPAEPFALRFRTGGAKPAVAADGPRVIKTNPPNGAKDLEAGTFDLTLVFSEPMKKGPASIRTPEQGPRLKMIGKPRWQDARTFVVPIMLAPATTYRVDINAAKTNQFVSAGDGTPAARMDLVFSTAGTKPVPAPKETPTPSVSDADKAGAVKVPAAPKPSPGGPVQLRYDYRKGDAGRVTQMNNIDVKIKLSNGKTVPVVRKVGLLSIEEVLAAEGGMPVEVRKRISELVMVYTDEQTGQLQGAPRVGKGVEVKVNRRSDPPRVERVGGEVSKELMTVLAQDYFPDVLPPGKVGVGQVATFPDETLDYLKAEFGTQAGQKMDVKLTCTRIGPETVEDARNQMFRDKGGGTPVTYTFDAAVFGVKWLQEGTMPGNIPFTLEGKGKLVFAIRAGVLLNLEIDGKITIKQIQTRDEQGQAVTATGEGTYKYEYEYEPIAWTRGAQAGADRPASDTPKPAPKPAPKTPATPPAPATGVDAKALGTPKGSIAYQMGLIKAGNVAVLKQCFTDRLTDQITPEAVKEGQAQLESFTIQDLQASTVELMGLGQSTAKITMKGGRTLTTLKKIDDKWLADTVWFK